MEKRLAGLERRRWCRPPVTVGVVGAARVLISTSHLKERARISFREPQEQDSRSLSIVVWCVCGVLWVSISAAERNPWSSVTMSLSCKHVGSAGGHCAMFVLSSLSVLMYFNPKGKYKERKSRGPPASKKWQVLTFCCIYIRFLKRQKTKQKDLKCRRSPSVPASLSKCPATILQSVDIFSYALTRYHS